MPNRWFLPVPQLDPGRVRREFVHAAVSRWFDHSGAEHAANNKPYTISSVVEFQGRLGIMITTLTHAAEEDLLAAVSSGVDLRLGNQIRTPGRLALVHSHTWDELEQGPAATRWTIDLISPCTFRSGDRSTPLPSVTTILGGLDRSWSWWSDRTPRDVSAAVAGACWVSDLDLTSEAQTLEIKGRGEPKRVTLACVTGTLQLRCDQSEAAAQITPLLRLAPYAGLGSMRGKGFGLVRVRSDRLVAAPARQVPDASLEAAGWA